MNLADLLSSFRSSRGCGRRSSSYSSPWWRANAARRLLLAWSRRLERTSTPWDDALAEALRRPLRVLIWVVGVAFAASLAPAAGEGTIFEAVGVVRDVGVVACIAWFLVRFVGRAEENLLARETKGETGPDRATVDALAKLLRASIVITRGPRRDADPRVQHLRGARLRRHRRDRVGFAARDMLANFFGALTIYLDRPLLGRRYHPVARSRAHGHRRADRMAPHSHPYLREPPLYVPNSVFATIAIENFTRMFNRRIYETIGVRYDDMSPRAADRRRGAGMLESASRIRADEFLMVNFDAFAPSSLDFFIYAFTRTKAVGRVPRGQAGRVAQGERHHRAPRGGDRVPDQTIHLAGSPDAGGRPGS